MKKSLLGLLTLTIAIVFTSCGISAEKFNDTLVNSQKTILTDYERIYALINKEDADKAQLKLQEDSLIIKIDTEITKIEALEAPKGGEEFKASAIEAFQAYRNILEVTLKATAFTETTTPEEYNAYIEELNKVVVEGSKSEDNFLAKQREFASTNGMLLAR